MERSAERLFTAPELAEVYGVTPRALRFYETKGLLSPRRIGARRVYDHRDRGRLQLILRAKRLGFSLAEVGEYLELYDADPDHTEQLKRLENLVDVRLEKLERQQAALKTTLRELREIRSQVVNTLAERLTTPASPKVTASRSDARPKIRPKPASR
jgi:DNA-binding transcriptional MerR regulator